ncbi:MAG: CsgG/HfaB family protein [Spirochaetaceae bacterium]|nr:CsgG/HfaB family protein [Spirochaetaceae bacterium]
MKRIVTPLCSLIVITVLLISCAGGPPSEKEYSESGEQGVSSKDLPREIMDVVEAYETAVRNRDFDLLAEFLSPDPLLSFHERSGVRTDINGLEAIAEFRLDFFGEFGPQENYRLGELNLIEGLGSDHVALEFLHEVYRGSEWLSLYNVDGTWKIQHIFVGLRPSGEWVTNRYQALTDFDGNGFLDGEEQSELMEMTHRFYSGPHPVETAVDEHFDLDGDGFIDIPEIAAAADFHFLDGPMFWKRIHPGNIMNPELDLNGDGAVDEGELEQIRDLMAGEGDVSADRGELIHMLSYAHYPDTVRRPVPRDVSEYLDELADGNGDGIVDNDEQDFLLDSLTPADKEARNRLEWALDRNRDGWVETNDIFLALQASALGRGVAGEGAEPPYKVRTLVDDLLDRERDGRVDAEDMEIAVGALAGDLDLVRELRNDLVEILDWNDDGRIEFREIEEAKGLLIFPRPVNSDEPIDRSLDENRDGFIDPEELGITAGITDKGEVPPFEERIAMARRRIEMKPDTDGEVGTSSPSAQPTSIRGSDYYRKLGSIQDKKLAVVTLNVGTSQVDDETATGIVVFVENAFVNVGKVKVVDRANIQAIFEEFEFQATGVIDENTAVEIGKLSGADIIVIGSINRVGGVFYLNIKLIAVQTAEIIGSSIAQAADATGFLEMANQAVYKLF